MKPSSVRINVAASTKVLDVDNRISLRYYFRIADNVLKQANIFRAEKNYIDLYIMLLRFSSLVTETIPRHRDYRASSQAEKNYLKKKSLEAVIELESLKPTVERKIDELSRKHTHHIRAPQNNSFGSSQEWPSVKKQNSNMYVNIKAQQPAAPEYAYQNQIQQFSHASSGEPQFRRLSLSIPLPKEETLSRHSILGPNGLRGQWQPPTSFKGISYPSNIDLTPVEIPRLDSLPRSDLSRDNSKQHLLENGNLLKKDSSILSDLETTLPSNNDNKMPHTEELGSLKPLNNDIKMPQAEELGSLISFDTVEPPAQVNLIRQPSPPPVLADVQDLIPTTLPPVTEAEYGREDPSSDGLACSESPMELHISTTMMESFMKLAKSNTNKNLETCGILAGSLKNRKFYITALIIPKQESTSDSCQATNEEEIFEVQDTRSLFPLGWIHTHPTQSCFMSSIDVHTHYSYQIMLPESVAIVMAPKDSSRNHGIFRLTNPGGMGVIRNCPRRGFHSHDPPSDGSPIYKQCTDVYLSPNVKFDVIDLR
ncbi:AMSH-like ubiquitin thioesterase 1 isoform X1 [Daucus carota subsp. sativus]|uniref:AMSH-like ubiquitin thioesterase 1 isoform X1 n=1 Tax=Daucus carota subsp. sativus TaxID=79200 RepID=UPI0007EF0F2C|nr:PREDICTED: AMSH-like ubiquitin thioesterase 1 [Daucus carota subsp. sativus]